MTDATLLAVEAWPWLLIGPLVVAGGWWVAQRRSSTRRTLLGDRAADALDAGPVAVARRVLLGAALLVAAAALLRPAWGETTVAVEPRGADLVVCLDVSRSMAARDMTPDRAGAALAELQALATEVAGDRLALVVFAGSARTAVPLTRDLRSVLAVAERAGPHSVPDGGTDLGAALRAAARVLGEATGDHAAVLLLTDGEDHDGRALEVARRLGEQGLRVHCLGLGTEAGSKIPVRAEDGAESFLVDEAGEEVLSRLDGRSLARLAEATGGVYAPAGRAGLVDLYRSEVRPRVRAAFDEERRRERPERFQWALAVAFALGILELCLLPPVLR